MFCKIEDSNNKIYFLTDKDKQPLLCVDNKCTVFNVKKILDNHDLLNNPDIIKEIFEESNIDCKIIPNSIDVGLIKNKNIGDYKIANYNEQIINYTNEYSIALYAILSRKTNNEKLEILQKYNDYLQKSFTEEDLSKTNIEYNKFNFNNFDSKILLDFKTLSDFNNNNNNVMIARGFYIVIIIIIFVLGLVISKKIIIG